MKRFATNCLLKRRCYKKAFWLSLLDGHKQSVMLILITDIVCILIVNYLQERQMLLYVPESWYIQPTPGKDLLEHVSS